jgi:hypothetical protein
VRAQTLALWGDYSLGMWREPDLAIWRAITAESPTSPATATGLSGREREGILADEHSAQAERRVEAQTVTVFETVTVSAERHRSRT